VRNLLYTSKSLDELDVVQLGPLRMLATDVVSDMTELAKEGLYLKMTGCNRYVGFIPSRPQSNPTDFAVSLMYRFYRCPIVTVSRVALLRDGFSSKPVHVVFTQVPSSRMSIATRTLAQAWLA